MLKGLLFLSLFFIAGVTNGQTITYSQVERSDTRNMDFEILGNFSGNYLVYKNLNKRHELTIYDNNIAIKETVKLDFVSDRTSNLNFITYPDHFIMIWQYEKGSVTYCKGANISGTGKLIGAVADMDTTKSGFFSNKVYYDLAWSEDKKQVLLYKVQTRNDEYAITAKLYDEQLALKDSSRRILSYNDRRESFGDLQVSNDGTIVFTKVRSNARPEYINTIELNFKKPRIDSLITIGIPLDERLVQEPLVKIDNMNGRYLLNTFSYRKNGNVEGLMSALIDRDFHFTAKNTTIFDDSLRARLSGKPDWRTAYDNFYLRNIILKKDGGFIVVGEEYYKQRRFGNTFDDRYSQGPYGFGYRNYSASDYYLYNRGYYGYYRPFNDQYGRDIIYNYNDVITLSFNKDLIMQWDNVINKTTADIENDNFLSFANMNAGGEIHFLFLQKDNNRQVLSDHALQPNGNIIRYATLKGREAGYYFMPRLGRQTGLHQMIIPCVVRNNIAFAKIDF